MFNPITFYGLLLGRTKAQTNSLKTISLGNLMLYLCTGTDKKVPQKAAKSISLHVDGKSALSSNNHVQNGSTVSVTYFVF